MEKTLVTKACLGCSLLGTRGDRPPPAAVNPGMICLAVLTFCSPNVCARTPERSLSYSGGLSFPHTHLGELLQGCDDGKAGTCSSEVGESSVLEGLLAFQRGESLSSFVYLSVPQLTPGEKLRSGQEAQSTQKDDYTTQVYLCLPLTCPSVSSPGGWAAQVP